jgi:hypothetical protein
MDSSREGSDARNGEGKVEKRSVQKRSRMARRFQGRRRREASAHARI